MSDQWVAALLRSDASIHSVDGWMQVVLHTIAVCIGAVGVAVLVWGVMTALLGLLRVEWLTLRGLNAREPRDALRHHLGYYLLLSLEFLVAADIVATLIQPDLEHLAVLGAIVVIRTVISVSLNWELAQSHPPPEPLHAPVSKRKEEREGPAAAGSPRGEHGSG